MLELIGADSIDELFADIPESLRLGRPLDLPDGKPETEVYDRLSGLASRNAHAEAIWTRRMTPVSGEDFVDRTDGRKPLKA